jgi:hypothetical protein
MRKLGINPHPVSELKLDSTDTSDTPDIAASQDSWTDITSSE